MSSDSFPLAPPLSFTERLLNGVDYISILELMQIMIETPMELPIERDGYIVMMQFDNPARLQRWLEAVDLLKRYYRVPRREEEIDDNGNE